MRSAGLAKATTKRIAREAGYSEAMLYKYFADKQELFLAVLQERVGTARIGAATTAQGDLVEDLAALIENLMSFFVAAFPIAASVFSSPELLRQHREGMAARNSGPDAAVRGVQAYLESEQRDGRISSKADCGAVARFLVGAAFHQGFLAAFAGHDTVNDSHAISRGLAQTIHHSLT